MRCIEHRSVLLSELARWEAEGYEPVVTVGGAVGADPFSCGLGASVLVRREVEMDGEREEGGE